MDSAAPQSALPALALQDEPSPLQKIFLNQHIPPTAENMMECYDRDFVEQMLQMNIPWEDIPPETDTEAWREWDRKSFFDYDRTIHVKPSRCSVPVHTTDIRISYGENNEYGIRIYNPQDGSSEARPAVLSYHGGAWTHSKPSNDEALSAFFASELRAVVFGIDYRLAPEHDIRSIHEDCYHAIEWVVAHAVEYRVDPSRVALWGCSAGGHLVASVAMRDAREHNPSRLVQVNISVPALCHPEAIEGPLMETMLCKWQRISGQFQAGEDPLKPLKYIYGLIAPPSLATSDPLVSPLRHPLPWPEHHPPTHVTVAGCDWARDEGIAYALKLRDSGIDTVLEVVPGVPHGFAWCVKAKATTQWMRNQVKVFDYAFRKDKRS